MQVMCNLLFSLPLVAIFMLLGIPNSYAQDIEEVVIEVEQPTDELVDDLVSVSALDAEKLADAGIENVEDVAAYVPNLVLTETSTGTAIVIRGIGAGVNQGFDQSVGLFLDGVPLPRSQMARAPFLDLKGVQVLRGPQYVKDGNFSIAGSVHLLTQEAEDEFKLGVDLNYVPSQNDQKLLVTLGTPFAEWGGMRLAVQRQTSDGYVENVTRNEDGPQSDDLLVRGVFSFLPTDSLAIKLKYEYGRFDTVGRQIEIIDSQVTPDFRQFPQVIANGGRVSPPANRLGIGAALLPDYRNEVDFQLGVIGSLYDIQYQGAQDVPAFAGLSYLQALHNLYTNNLPEELRDPLDGVLKLGGIPTSAGFNTPPVGLLDANADFKRAVDAEEFSNNQTSNFTLNLSYFLGEHNIALVASRIDYKFDEQIDLDFTPVPIFDTEQSEEYEQDFFRFEYNSPDDGFIQLSVGGSYLSSKLTYNQIVRSNLGGPTNQEEAEQFLRDGIDPATYTTFDPDVPFLTYFGRVTPALIRGLQFYSPDLLFNQDTEITAAFIESKMYFSDTVSVVLGARYTHAEKAAIRDFAFLLSNGEPFQSPPPDVDLTELNVGFLQGLGTLFNFQIQSDRMAQLPFNGINPDTGCLTNITAATGGPCDLDFERNKPFRDEQLLPSLTLVWDVTQDLSLNFSARQANKVGGFDARSSSAPRVPEADPVTAGTFRFQDEDATTYELGSRWFLPNGWGELYATAFYTTFKNLQVSTSDGSVGFNVRNAGEARAYGIEVEGLLQPTERFGITYSMAWIDFAFTNYPFGSCALTERPDYFVISREFADDELTERFPIGSLVPIIYEGALVNDSLGGSVPPLPGFGQIPNEAEELDSIPGGTGDFYNFQRYDFLAGAPVSATFCDFNGKTNQYVAEYQGTFSFNYVRDIVGVGIFKPTLDVLYNSGYQTTVTQDDDVAQDSYFQFNGRLSLGSFDGIWEWALVGENLTNEKIVGTAAEVPLSRLQGSKTHFGFLRPPRSIGLNFRYNFY